MKRLILMAALALTFTVSEVQAESLSRNTTEYAGKKKKKTSERRTPGEFTKIVNETAVNIIYTQASNVHVLDVQGLEADINRIITTVVNGVLTITQKGNGKFQGSPTIAISSHRLIQYDGNGSGSFTSTSRISNNQDMTFNMKGSGNLKVNDLDCRNLKVNHTGSGNVWMNEVNVSGNSDIQSKGSGSTTFVNAQIKGKNEVSNTGSGKMTMNGTTKNSTVRNSGSGKIKGNLNADDSFEGSTTGSGNISMKGASRMATTQSTGSGKAVYKNTNKDAQNTNKGKDSNKKDQRR